MKRTLAALVAALLLVGLMGYPALADHVKGPVTLQVNSGYAGVCSNEPGQGSPGQGFINALTTNRTFNNEFEVPDDLGSGAAAGACQHASDPLWAASIARHTPTCNATTFSGCIGVWLPGAGPPVKPGRFLQYTPGANPSVQAACNFASTSGTAGTCYAAALGYFGEGGSTLGGYCGSSRGFSWSLSATNLAMTENQVFAVAGWEPNSAGTLLPLRGITTGPNWSPNGHNFTGLSGSNQNRSWTSEGGQKFVNIYGLASARSYLPGESQPQSPGSCGSSTAGTNGARQFLAQTVAVQTGP